MSRSYSNAVTAGLFGAGALVWACAAKPLVSDVALDIPLNPMGINRSPYGEVFAMAMQGPIDSYWVRGLEADQAAGVVRRNLKEDAIAADGPKPAPIVRYREMLEKLDRATIARTNPQPASKAYSFHVRRQIENKLKFAYYLDPSNYANYNSYHFYLTEPTMGTRPELSPGALQLADETIEYCLREKYDARAAMTAAAAACNVLELMFNDLKSPKPRYTVARMHEYLNTLDRCIARHDEIAEEWNRSGHKALLSSLRLQEYEDRVSFVRKIRDAAKGGIQRLATHASN